MSASGIWMNSNLLRAALRPLSREIQTEYAEAWERYRRETKGRSFEFCIGALPRTGKQGKALAAIKRLDRAARLASEIFVSTEDIELVGI